MNNCTLGAIEATIVCFIMEQLDCNYCRLDDQCYIESTDTCRIRVILDDGYKVNVRDFEKLVVLKSHHILSITSSIVGDAFEMIVSDCVQYFESTNQIITKHKRKTKIFVITIFVLFFIIWIAQFLNM